MKKTFTQKRFAACRKWLLAAFVSLAAGTAALHGATDVQLLNPTVTLSVQDESLTAVLQSIIKQAGCEIVYMNTMTNGVRCRNVNVKEASVNQALTAALSGTDLTYAVQNGKYVISARQNSVRPSPAMAGDEGRRITGVVLSSDGEPLVGATVLVKGTTQGARTDARGNFTINAQSPVTKPTLVFSYVGMEQQEAVVEGDDPLRITMKDSPTAIGPVTVNTGYQTIDSRLTTGSYTIIQAKDLSMDGIANIDQMLEGRVAGMLVTMPSAKVGTTAKVSIRGQSTLLGNTDPLWVVDGIIMPDPPKLTDLSSQLMIYGNDLRELAANQISWLNPLDIETVTVLKDAAATSIYGAKASNGVIVITTKRGKGDGKTSVSFSTGWSIKTKPSYANLNVMNSQEWVDFYSYYSNKGAKLKEPPLQQATTLSGLRAMYDANGISEEDYRNTVAKFINGNTDWLDLLCRTGVMQRHNLSLSGGTEGMDYNVSGGYVKEQGQEKGNDSEQYTMRTNVGFKLGRKVQVRTDLYASFANKTGFANGVDPFQYAMTTSRAIPAYDEDGELFFYRRKASYAPNETKLDLGYNVINELAHGGSTVKDMQINGNFSLVWEIIPGLKYTFVGGMTQAASFGELYMDEETFLVANKYRGYDFEDPNVVKDGADGVWRAAMLNYGGVFRTADAHQASYNVQNQFSYEKLFNENHRLNVFLANEVTSSTGLRHENVVFGYMPNRGMGIQQPNENFKPITTSGGMTPFLGVYEALYGGGGESGGWSAYQPVVNRVSFFSNVAYSLRDRYVFTGSLRSDASNTFGQDINKRFDPTYAVGVAWYADQEGFVKSIDKWVQQLKVRVSYGVNGLDAVSQSPYPIFMRGDVNSMGWKTSRIVSLPNPYLSWERTKNFGLGVDFYVFGFLSGVIEYYERRSQITQRMVVPLELGVETMAINGGKINNRGIEFTFNITPIKTQDVGLNIRFNTGKNFNEGKANTLKDMTTSDYLSGGTNQIVEGYPLGALWAWSFKGFNEVTGLPEFNNLDIPDEEHSEDYDPKKFLVYVGSTVPDLTGGLTLAFRYKSFTLTSNFSVALGGKYRLPNPFDYPANSTEPGNLPIDEINLSRDLLRARKGPGDQSEIPAFFSDQDGSTFKVLLPTDAITSSPKSNIYEMWANSDARIINNSYLRCTTLSLSWTLNSDWTQRMGLKTVNLNFSMNNVFVIANKRLNGYDPGFAIYGVQRTAPKSFNFGVNLSF